MGILNWLSNPPKDQVSSRESAKERLQMTVFHDRMEMLSLPPEKLEALQEELIEVVGKYFEVNLRKTECHIEEGEDDVALSANIHIKKSKK